MFRPIPRASKGSRALAFAAHVSLLALASLAPGCTPPPPGGSARAQLEMLVATDAETLDPRYAVDAVSMRVSRMVHAGLVRLDPDTLAPVPYVAASWSWQGPLTLRVELRPDVRFHSGRELTAHDVGATLRAFASPVVGSRHARVVEAIAAVDEDGPRTLTVRLKRPHATLVTDLELPILRADEAAGPPNADGTLDGLGPYVIAEATRGALRLEPATDSALPRPAHAVIVRTVRDENARALRMHAGRADIALNVFSPTLLPAMDGRPGLALTARPGANLTYLVLRTDRGPFADVRVRRALSLAIDRAEITATLLAGRARPASTLIPPNHWAHAKPPGPLPFDRARARSELTQAGAHVVRATWLTSTERLRVGIARAIAQDLREVGIELEVIPLELGTLLARLNAGDFDLASLMLPEMTEPNVLRVFMHSVSIPPAGANRGRIVDPRVDELLDEGERATEVPTRLRAYAALEAHVRDTLPIVPLWHEDQVVITSERARTFIPSAEGRWLGIAAIP